MEAAREDEVLRAGQLEIRPAHSLVLADGKPLILSVREYQVLLALARRTPRTVSREELSQLIWKRRLRGGDRSVDVYVHKLRQKLEAALPDMRFIHTHVGFGYRFSSEPSHGFHNAATRR
jgi:DNA-binding response OmpR family regulator